MTNTATAANVAGNPGEKQKEKEKPAIRRALGRGLASLLPGPRVVTPPPTNISALPIPVNDLRNATALCPNSSCNVPITNPQKQLLFPSGALGDFFGPGTTVGIPFAAQLGVRVNF